MMRKMLFIADGMHYPPDSGYSLRVYSLFRIYAEFLDVYLIVNFFEGRNIELACEHIASLTKARRLLLTNASDKQLSAWKKFSSLVEPISVVRTRASDLKKITREMYANHGPFDYVHVDRLRMTELIRQFLRGQSGKTRFILDLDDWESEKRFLEARMRTDDGYIKTLKRSIEPLRLRRYEKRVLPLYNLVYLSSENDCSKMRSELKLNNVITIPNGYNVTTRNNESVRSSKEPERILLFVGSLSYGPNVDAVDFFVKKIYPKILGRVNDAKLWIVGADAPARIKGLTKNPSVRLMGFVEDLKEVYSKASIVVVPIRYGGGTRIKILEAASYSKAIVSTPFGCQGLNFEHDQSIVIVGDPEQFAEACCVLLEDQEKRVRLGAEARRVVENEYQWQKIGLKVREALIRDKDD